MSKRGDLYREALGLAASGLASHLTEKAPAGRWSTRNVAGSRHLELLDGENPQPWGNLNVAHSAFKIPCPDCERLQKLAADLNLLAWLDKVAPETMKSWRETYAEQGRGPE
jgi:hypothetical protein